MKEFLVKLDSINAVKDFVNLASMCQGKVFAFSDQYIVDGKSIMGMYSLNLSEPIKVEIEGEVPEHVKIGMTKFIVLRGC